MEILSILQRHFGDYRKSTEKAGHENYSFFCPFCAHKKRKLEVDILTGFWHCWVCNAKGRSFFSLLKRKQVPKDILASVRQRYSVTGQNKAFGGYPAISLPDDYIPLYEGSRGFLRNVALSYLNRRGITEADIQRHKIGYCEKGKYQDCIIIPNYDSGGKLNYFVGRTFRQWSAVNYIGAVADKNIIGFENLISWDFPILLVEGPFDAIVARRNAIPLYGKTIRPKLKETILEEYPPEVYIAVDPDASKEMNEIAGYFSSNGINTKVVDLGEHDPADWGFHGLWNRIENNSSQFNVSTAFTQKIKMML
jgi:DNA primase